MNEPIEYDDEKMEELIFLQTLSKKPEFNSIEEKYEEEILLNEVVKSLDKAFEQKGQSDSQDQFEEFFVDIKDEQR